MIDPGELGKKRAAKILPKIPEGPRAPTEEAVSQYERYQGSQEAQRLQAERRTAMPGGFGPGDRPLEDIPGYDRLTRFERSLMGALPGIANSKVGQFLANLNEGWLGKAFTVIDAGAEAVERATGFGAQALAAVGSEEGWQDFTDNLASAWYAGTFAADFANLPQWSNGKLEVPVDLPGVDGLVRARQQIVSLADQGMDMGEATAQVRQQFMDDAGALALRMQWHDMVFHVVADPLNIILPILKPVERIKIVALRGLAGAIPADVAAILPKVDDAMDAARAAGNADELARLQDFGAAIRALPEITPAQQAALRLSGAVDPDSFWARLSKWKLNPFGLTPESRARELAVNLNDNVLNMLARAEDPEDMARLVTAMADGTFDPRVAHMVVTHEGRMVKGLLGGFASQAQDAATAWRVAGNERNFLAFMSQVLGEDAQKVLMRIFENDEAAVVFDQLIEKGAGRADELARLAASVGLDPNTLTAEALIAKLDPLYRTGLLTPEMFQAQLMIKLMDTTARSLVSKFGVKESGFIVKFAESLKSAESLAFLRLNPGYFVRNLINGEVTLAARGVFAWSATAGEEFIKALGFTPSRMRSGFGIAGIGIKAAAGDARVVDGMAAIDNVLREATAGTGGWLDKLKRTFSGVDLGKFDMGAQAAKIEALQSERAYIAGMMRFRRKYMQVTHMGDEARDALRVAVGDDGVRSIERAMKEALNDADVDKILVSDNLNLNPQSIIDNAAEKFGTDLDDVIQVEELDGMVNRVSEAFRAGGADGARDAAERIRVEVAQKLRSQLDDELADIAEDVAVRTRLGGPDEALRQHAEGIDVFWGESHAQYAQEFGVAYDAIRKAAPEARPSLWEGAQVRSRAFWDEKWSILRQRADGVVEGIKRVEKETGQKFPFKAEYKTTFKEWEKTWSGFWKYRDKQYAKWAAGEADFEDIVGQVNAAYEKAVQAEQRTWLHMDEITAQMVHPSVRDLYMAGRNQVSEWRDAMRQYVVQFQDDPFGDGRRYIDLADEEKALAYKQFWQVRSDLLEKIKGSEDELKAAMMGMRQAIDNAAPALQRNNIVAEAKAIFSRLRASGDLPADTYGETFFSSWLTRAREHQMGMADLKVYGNRTEWALGTADEAVMKVLDQTASEIGATRQGVMDALLGAAGDGTLRVEGGTYQFNVVGGHMSKLEGQWLPEQPYFQLDQITAVSRRRGAGTEAVRELLLEAQRRGKTQMTTTLQSDLGQPFFESLVKKGWLKPAGEVRLPPGAEGIELKPLPLYDINYDAIKAAEQGEFFWNAMPDVDGVLKRPRPDIEGMHELWYSRGSQALNSIVDATVEQGSKKALKFSGLGADEQRAVRGYAAAVKSNLSSQRYQMSKFGEWTRDSALLNYQRRMNYNTWLGVLMPYEFWATTTIRKWALHSLDRPFMATTYMRMQRMLDQGFRPESGLPARMRHTIRIKAPFLPEFLGNELFIDPLGAALPFSAWRNGIERIQGQIVGDVNRAENVLNEMLQDGTITQQEFDAAKASHQGTVWDRALGLAKQDDTEGRMSALDTLSVLSSPHAPILWAYNALSGHPEKIGAFTPIERSIKGLTALLGIGPAGGVNPLGAIRRELGLPEFDQWDDYRVDRMLSSMSADGSITVEQAKRAMIERNGAVFEEAKRRAGIEFGVGAMGSLIGLPAKAYPQGEENLRKLKDDYEAAWAAYEAGDDKALTRFYDTYPEYETRLALWDKPEERLQRFVVDEIWNLWNGLPVQHKREVSEQLGELFQEAFLDRETRSYENIPLNILQTWLKIMGGDPPGMVHFSETLTPLDLTDPDIAQRLQGFYLTRDQNFQYREQVSPLMDDYFRLDKNGRKAFLRSHPILKQYWDWRRDFMIRNPTLAPYIEDDPEKLPTYRSEQALQEAQAAEPAFTWFEWQNVLGLSTWRLIRDTMALDEPIPETMGDELQAIAEPLGIDADELLSRVVQSYEESQ